MSLLLAFAVSLFVFAAAKNDTVETVVITIGVTLYHFAMRLAVGTVVNAVMKNRADPKKQMVLRKSF